MESILTTNDEFFSGDVALGCSCPTRSDFAPRFPLIGAVAIARDKDGPYLYNPPLEA
jgi:hypothetical protein